ncbi:MAG TPA: hypothetical protein VFE78_00620, partial [Gemmataceae bacterium]|nr:hypothetical protein [Gemmataceae bacterium]
MPKSCIVRHPRDGQKVRAIHARPGGKPSFLHFVASGELAKAEEVGAVLKGPDGKETKGTTKTKPTETFWIIAFHIEAPDPAAVYDLEIRDGSGATLAVCKKLQFLESHNSLTIDVPSGEDVCPTFTCSGTSTTTSPIQASACKVGGTAANVTIVQNPNGDGEWIVKFNNCAITDPNPTTVAVGQVDGS